LEEARTMLREAVALDLEDEPFPNAVFRFTVADPP
jgi:hypothetical protein